MKTQLNSVFNVPILYQKICLILLEVHIPWPQKIKH